MIVRCALCNELVLVDDVQKLLIAPAEHVRAQHAQQFEQIARASVSVVSALALDLFDTQQAEVAEAACLIRRAAEDGIKARYSRVTGQFQITPTTREGEEEYSGSSGS